MVIKTEIDSIISEFDVNAKDVKDSALALWYAYECIFTENLDIFPFGEKTCTIISDMAKSLNLIEYWKFKELDNTPRLKVYLTLLNELEQKFNLTNREYFDFKETDHPLISKIYSILFLKEIDPNAKHVSNIPGITGKGDLSKKAHYRALNPDLNHETAMTFTYGKIKHSEDNFRKMNHEAAGEIWDALMRHLEAYRMGESHAEDSKKHHLAHACANLHMLFRLTKNHGDDTVIQVITGGDNGLKEPKKTSL